MLIRNATLADGRVRDVRIEDGRIDAVDEDLSEGEDGTEENDIIDATGKRLLPGVIDAHVHVREPGFTHKENWETISQSAAAGGVTTIVDQPNTDPATIDAAGFDAKEECATDSLVEYGISGGVIPEWDPDSLFDRPLFVLGEVFLADSTGGMGIDDELFADAAARAADEGAIVTVHAEDDTLFDEDALAAAGDGTGRDADADAWSAYRPAKAEVAAIELACERASEAGAELHIAHTTSPEAIDAAVEGGATCEVCPHHLFLSRDDLDELGTYGMMNPPLRSEDRREGVFERVADGRVDIIASDHAPHLPEEKEAPVSDAPSGVPGVETTLPLLLAAAENGKLTWERVQELTATNPADIFDLPRKGAIEEGMDADLVLVDPDTVREIRGEELHSKCGWTPYEGFDGIFPELTVVRGEIVYDTRNDERFGEAVGSNVRR